MIDDVIGFHELFLKIIISKSLITYTYIALFYYASDKSTEICFKLLLLFWAAKSHFETHQIEMSINAADENIWRLLIVWIIHLNLWVQYYF